MKSHMPITLLAVGILLGVPSFAGIHSGVLDENKTTVGHEHILATNSDKYDMVIITPNEFSDDIQPLINHKNSVGIATFLKTTEEIYDEFDGFDEAEKIKYFIRDSIEQYNIEYVLLAGGRKGQSFQWYIPPRYVHLDDGARYTMYLSDLYFADVYAENGDDFETWDSNENGIYGEWGIDNMNLKPDISVGRLPCRNSRDLQSVINKIITYENNAYGQSWFHKIVAVGGDTRPDLAGEFPYEGEVVVDYLLQYMGGFDSIKLFASDGTLTTSTDVINAINQGCGFFYFNGRGGTNQLLTFMPDGASITPLHNIDITKLNNRDMNPICVFGGCLTGKFEVSILNILNLQDSNYQLNDCTFDCIGWSSIKKASGGAIACIAPTSQCWVQFGDNDNDNIPDIVEVYSGWYQVELFKVYAEENIDILGDLHVHAITNYIDTFSVSQNKIDCKTIQEFVLIGDPSLKIGGYP